MRNKLFVFALLFPTAFCFSQSIKPDVINIAGGSSKNGYYQIEWSVGEMALVSEMQTRSNLTITNGFLQPYILFPANYSLATFFEAEEIKVFPNPAAYFVEINFRTRQKGRITLRFFDAAGKTVYTQQVNCYGVDIIQRVPVNTLPTGTYMVQISLDSFLGYVSKSGVYKFVKAP
jgi:hypothetical protein